VSEEQVKENGAVRESDVYKSEMGIEIAFGIEAVVADVLFGWKVV